MRPAHLKPVLDHLDSPRMYLNRMSHSPYDPSNDQHAHNAKAALRSAVDYFVMTGDTFRQHRQADLAIDAVHTSCRRNDQIAFEDARRDALRAIDDLEASLTISGPNDLARAMGLVF